jgi:glutamate--cysteine ligase
MQNSFSQDPLFQPLSNLEKNILEHQATIENWFNEQFQKVAPIFYTSVDLRNSGFKMAPVDTNLFPAGFNNIDKSFYPLAVEAIKKYLTIYYSTIKKILIIPENHTRNTFYIQNVITLASLITEAGYEVQVGSFSEDFSFPLEVTSASGEVLTLQKVVRNENYLYSADVKPDLIILNNDLSEGFAEILKNIEQPIVPAPELGWHSRLKSDHFQHYDHVATQFANAINIDAWLINPLFEKAEGLDFMSGEGVDSLYQKAESLFSDIHKKYDEYGLKEKPFMIVKADAGTYGMGVMSVTSAEELRQLNRKERTRMSVTKGKQTISQVILQEGVYTVETLNNATSEPVIYMMGGQVIGGFYRVNEARSITENLNAPGMFFKPMSLSVKNISEELMLPAEQRFYVYSVIARLAALAAAYEHHDIRERGNKP